MVTGVVYRSLACLSKIQLGWRRNRTSTISKSKTDWDEFDALTDEQVRRGIEADHGVHTTDEDFWKTANVAMPQPKETMTIRLDADVVLCQNSAA